MLLKGNHDGAFKGSQGYLFYSVFRASCSIMACSCHGDQGTLFKIQMEVLWCMEASQKGSSNRFLAANKWRILTTEILRTSYAIVGMHQGIARLIHLSKNPPRCDCIMWMEELNQMEERGQAFKRIKLRDIEKGQSLPAGWVCAD